MNTVDPQPLYGWNTLDWKKIERVVFKLQTRIYRAQHRGDRKTVRKLQRLLMKSRSAQRQGFNPPCGPAAGATHQAPSQPGG